MNTMIYKLCICLCVFSHFADAQGVFRRGGRVAVAAGASTPEYDASAFAKQAAVDDTLEWLHTNTGSDVALIVYASAFLGGEAETTSHVSYGQTPLTWVGGTGSASLRTSMWVLLDAPAGTDTVRLYNLVPADKWLAGVSISYTGVSGLGAFVGGGSYGVESGVETSLGANELLAGCIWIYNRAVTDSVATNQIRRRTNTTGSQMEPTASDNVTVGRLGWSWTGATGPRIDAVIVEPSAQAGGIEYTTVYDTVDSDGLDGWGQATSGVEWWNEGGAALKWVGYWDSAQETAGFIFYCGIPQGSTIDSATITWWIDANNSLISTDSVTFIGYDVDSVNVFHDDGSHTLAAHATNTDAQVKRDAPNGVTSSWYTTEDFAAVVQEIVDRPGFDSDKPIGIFLEWDTDENNRDFQMGDYCDSGNAPFIRVVYH